MIVSLNELQRTCQKAFRALEVAAGADDDGAFAVLWLQARGLDALTPLDAALDALERTPPRPLLVPARRADGGDVLYAGQPAVSIASDAFDFALACAGMRGMRVEVLVTAVKDGIFFAGALPRRSPAGYQIWVQWRDAEARRGIDVNPNGERCLYTMSDAAPDAAPADDAQDGGELARHAVRIIVDESHRRRGAQWRIDADEAQLERRAVDCATHGIEVPDALWARLLAFAKRTLTPMSDASRERGAGGGEDND